MDLDGKANDGKAGEGDNAMPDLERVYGTGGADTLVGGSGPNEFYGGPGNDVLRGRGGRDELFGDDGHDTLDGGRGRDHCLQGLGSGSKIACES